MSDRSEAYETILSWCRSDKRGIGHPVMRNMPDTEWIGAQRGKLCVFDMSRTEPKPGGHSWERTEVTLACGDTWEQCLYQLRARFTGEQAP